MENSIINFISNYGYIAIFLLILIENIFPPIPSEAVLAFGGAMTITTNMSMLGVIVVATLGSFLGALFLYRVGMLLSYERLERLVEHKRIRWLGFKGKNLEKTRRWFDRQGPKAVFLCRLIPVVRSLISIPAGVMKMSLTAFSLWTLLGTLLWNCILVYIGTVLKEHWSIIGSYIKEYAIIIIVVSIIGFIIYKIKYREKH